ncbi:CotH kinase family protein [Denitrobacterium detoxificans]|uniref:CotH kinase family protein n=1 Tax=Denitrobacterium detoxificans TaxID=79604 RepID=UPI0026ED276A|nr:CotH kinase family protein [Denitrobacterium detoxificans]MBE6465452.1 hypothetical protein [Denitrobacterium detoxificans]
MSRLSGIARFRFVVLFIGMLIACCAFAPVAAYAAEGDADQVSPVQAVANAQVEEGAVVGSDPLPAVEGSASEGGADQLAQSLDGSGSSQDNSSANDEVDEGLSGDALLSQSVGAEDSLNEGASSSSAAATEGADAALSAQGETEASDVASGETEGEIPAASESSYEESHQNVYRLYNPNSGEHFYTVSLDEAVSVCQAGWQWESVGWVAPITSKAPVFRLYNPNGGDHHYTRSVVERDRLRALGWKYEGISWYSDDSSQLPIYREYNPNGVSGAHNFTASLAEDTSLGKAGWNREGIAWYATNGSVIAIQGQWITTSAWGSKQTYWLASDGSIARSRIVTASEGAGYDIYVGSNGVVQKGLVTLSDGSTYYAGSHGALAPSFSAVVANGQSGVLQTLSSAVASNGVHLFLPACASTSSVAFTARALDGELVSVLLSGNGISAVVQDGTVISFSSLDALLSSQGSATFSISYGAGHTAPFIIMKSAYVDAMFLTSADAENYGRSYVEGSADHSAKASIAVTLLTPSGDVVYDADDLASGSLSTIKGRGNSTWGLGVKKPYQISLSKKADLLETGDSANKAKKWILLAGSADPTLIHTAIAYDLGLELGMLGMQGAFVDLYYDGEYRGTYYLCEKVEIKSGRVSITDLESAIEKACKKAGVDLEALPTAQGTNAYGYAYQYVDGAEDPDDITGGYLIERDGAYYASETCWFSTSIGNFVVKSPELCSEACMKYISEYMQRAIDAVYADVFYTDGSAPSFDLESLAQSFAVSEFFKNIDAFYTSTFFYKDADGPDGSYSVLYAEPLWDFDASMGMRIDWSTNAFRSYEGFVVPGTKWLYNSTVVLERVRELLSSSICPLLSDVVLGGADAVGSNGYLHSIAYYQNLVSFSQRMNEVMFGVTSFNNEFEPFETYDANVAYLKDWLTWRVRWMNDNIDTFTADNGVIENPTSVYQGVDYSDVYDFYYYQAMNPDVAAHYGNDYVGTLEHFVRYGMAEGRIASYNFNWATYRARYADLRAAFGKDKAAYYLHFIEYGFLEGRTAC